MNNASRPHDEAVVELLREDPAFADEYLAASMEAIDEPGGQEALLQALRHVAETQGMAKVAERAGLPRESLYKSLSAKGNPTLKTLLAVLNSAGLRLSVTRDDHHQNVAAA
jgi:probable addiction module antidote protein